MYDLVIIGAGPCGVMAAIQASKRNKKVLLLEQNDDILKKLALSGNGRCNLTNNKPIKEFLNHLDNPKYFYNIIKTFGPQEIIEYFTELGVDLKEENDNKIYPTSNKAKTIIDVLKKELETTQVNLNEKVLKITKQDDFQIVSDKASYTSKNVLLCVGGITYPELGNNQNNFLLASNLSHTHTKLIAQECSIKTYDAISDLMGVSLSKINIIVKDNDKHLEVINGDVLFTHFGLSGPGILNCSFAINKARTTNINVSLQLLNKNFEEVKSLIQSEISSYPTKTIKSFLKKHLPNALAEYIIENNKIKEVKNSYLSKDEINRLCHNLSDFNFKFKSFNDPKHAFVTGGGINLKELQPKTLESKLIPNLYFGGEMLDVCGRLGGYNITIALACGYTVGQNI